MPSYKLKHTTPLLVLLLAACGADFQQSADVNPQYDTTPGALRAADPAPSAIEALLNETAEQLSAPLSEEGKGYSYYTYGTKDLLYAVGDLDGDGVPEIAARVVYFMGVGSYDLVDIFADRGKGYQRVDFMNLYNLDLEDKVESLEIRDGLLHIRTVGIERGAKIRKDGAFPWRGPKE